MPPVMFSVITKYHKGRHSLFLYNSEIFYAFTQDILRSPLLQAINHITTDSIIIIGITSLNLAVKNNGINLSAIASKPKNIGIDIAETKEKLLYNNSWFSDILR